MPDSPKSAPPARPRRRRRWLRRLGLTVLFLAVLALYLDGPGSRWILRSVLHSQLDKQGLSGTVEVKGRLHSGYSLENVHFTGKGAIRLLEAEQIAVDYSLFKLIDKQIDRLSGRNISIVLHPEPTVEEAKDPDDPLKIDVPEDTIRDIRDLVRPVELEFGKLSVEIERDDQPSLSVALLGLTHRAEEDIFRITGLGTNVLGDEGLPSQDIDLDWGAEGLNLTRIKVLPRITVESLRIDLPAGQPAKALGKLTLAGASVEVEAGETGSARLVLADKALEIRDLIEELPFELDLAGTLRTLDVQVDDLLAPPAQWRGDLQLSAANLRSGRFDIALLDAKGSITKEGIALLTSLGADKNTELKITTPLPSGEGETLLANHPVDFNLELHALDKSLAPLIDALGGEAGGERPVLPAGSCSISGRLEFGTDGSFSQVAANWHSSALDYDGKQIPPLKGSAKLVGELAEATIDLAKPAAGEAISLAARADLKAGSYEGTAKIRLPDPSWAKAFLPGDSPLWKPSGPVGLDWTGSGSYKEMTHKGEVTVAKLGITSPNDSLTTIETTAAYDWPGSLALDPLAVTNGDLKVGGGLAWQDGVLSIRELVTADQTGPLMTLEGSLPLPEDAQTIEEFLDNEEAIDLTFDANKFELARLRNLLPVEIPDGYSAGLETKLRLSGTAAHPRLDGKLQVLQAKVPEPKGLPPTTAELEFSTTDNVLSAVGTLTEPGGEILKLDGELPLKVRDWATKPESFNEAAFKAHAVSETFEFARLEKFLPQLAGLKGNLGIDITAAGPVSKPELAGNAAVAIDHYPLPDTPYRLIENTKLLARFEGRRIFLDPSPVSIAGGKLVLSGEGILGDIPDGEQEGTPTFDFSLNLDADHALLWRDDSISARANAKLTLAGNLEEASLTGTIDIVESLFYKDIEIIPIGVPSTSAPKPKLPKIDPPAGGNGSLLPVPSPYGDWILDVKVRTADPILVRGNLASGRIEIDSALGGTLASPRPSGSIELKKLKAALPFSTLEVDQGTLTLQPDAPLDPTLDIRGSSSINQTKVRMLLFGPLSKPKYTLSSDPPLPENEILTLVATGATTADLEDTNTASMKAFQLMVEELRRRSQQPGSNELFKRLMRDLKDVELNVGENDPFTGRKFSSATLELSDKYFLSAGFDDQGNTRTSIIYSLRFR